MTCCSNEQPSSVIGCLNGTQNVVIHYDFVRYQEGDALPPGKVVGDIKGVTSHVSDQDGVLVIPQPTDTLTVGACPVSSPGGGSQDWELVFYQNLGNVGEPCRQIALVRDENNPTVFDAFELNGAPVLAFDSQYVRDSCCSCPTRTPNVVW